jgi:hypothetical protein
MVQAVPWTAICPHFPSGEVAAKAQVRTALVYGGYGECTSCPGVKCAQLTRDCPLRIRLPRAALSGHVTHRQGLYIASPSLLTTWPNPALHLPNGGSLFSRADAISNSDYFITSGLADSPFSPAPPLLVFGFPLNPQAPGKTRLSNTGKIHLP